MERSYDAQFRWLFRPSHLLLLAMLLMATGVWPPPTSALTSSLPEGNKAIEEATASERSMIDVNESDVSATAATVTTQITIGPSTTKENDKDHVVEPTTVIPHTMQILSTEGHDVQEKDKGIGEATASERSATDVNERDVSATTATPKTEITIGPSTAKVDDKGHATVATNTATITLAPSTVATVVTVAPDSIASDEPVSMTMSVPTCNCNPTTSTAATTIMTTPPSSPLPIENPHRQTALYSLAVLLFITFAVFGVSCLLVTCSKCSNASTAPANWTSVSGIVTNMAIKRSSIRAWFSDVRRGRQSVAARYSTHQDAENGLLNETYEVL